MKVENEAYPKDWKVVDFKNNIGLLGGYPFDSKKFNEEGLGLPLIRIRNILNGYSDTFFNGEFPEDYIIEKGDILVGMDGDFHIKKWMGNKSLLNQRILKLYEIPNSEINLDFFYYLAQPFLDKVHFRTAGTTVKHLSNKDFYNAKFKVPEIPEQQKIADILSTVDKKIAVIDHQITATEELKKGLMQSLLTKGIGHTEFKDSPLGKIPKSWEVVKLGSSGDFSKGKGLAKKDLSEKGIPCVRYGEIYTLHHNYIKEYKSFVGNDKTNSSKKLIKGDILFSGSGETIEEIGKAVAFLDDFEAYAGGDIIILKPNNDFNSLYLGYLLNHEIINSQKRKLGQGNSVVHIYASHLKSIILPKPQLKEQKEIANIFKCIDTKLQTQKDKKQAYLQLKKGLMQQLLTGKIRVNNLLEA